MNIALAHDWLVNYGGSERCVGEFHELYPEAPLYTSIWNKKSVPEFLDMDVRTSFLQKIPGAKSHHAFFLSMMPKAFESFDMSSYDVILTSVHACAKGVRKKEGALHIAYCHTPTRYVWDFYHRYISNPSYFGILNNLISFFAPYSLTKLRMWDREAADRVDYFIANSKFIAQRIKKYYRRESTVIYPPVDVDHFVNSRTSDDYYLLISRLVPYKRADIAVKAFNILKKPLVVAGDGPEYKNLKKIAGNTISFLGSINEDDKIKLMSKARAFIFPPEEDFGITPVEAMAAGRPVVAYGKGGALETVVNRQTGVFFPRQTPDALAQAVLEFEKYDFNYDSISQYAKRFDKSVFRDKIASFVRTKYNNNTLIEKDNHGV